MVFVLVFSNTFLKVFLLIFAFAHFFRKYLQIYLYLHSKKLKYTSLTVTNQKNGGEKWTGNMDKLLKINCLNLEEESTNDLTPPIGESKWPVVTNGNCQATTIEVPVISVNSRRNSDLNNTKGDEKLTGKKSNGLNMLHNQASLDSKITFIVENAENMHRSVSK